jgi:two-component system, cell cycle sensor histidine kinase and response regulator CckA
MPKIAGDTLAQKIRKIIPDIPIIICTGFSEKLTPEIASRISVRDILTNPIIKTKLAKTIRNIFNL